MTCVPRKPWPPVTRMRAVGGRADLGFMASGQSRGRIGAKSSRGRTPSETPRARTSGSALARLGKVAPIPGHDRFKADALERDANRALEPQCHEVGAAAAQPGAQMA